MRNKNNADYLADIEKVGRDAARKYILELVANEKPSSETEGRINEIPVQLKSLEEQRKELYIEANDLGWSITRDAPATMGGAGTYHASFTGILETISSQVYICGGFVLDVLREIKEERKKLKQTTEVK